MDFDALVDAQTALGTAAVIVMNKQVGCNVQLFCSMVLVLHENSTLKCCLIVLNSTKTTCVCVE
jgi:NADH:ubiquinone oxidoreductase subunit F (NADH-binding)